MKCDNANERATNDGQLNYSNCHHKWFSGQKLIYILMSNIWFIISASFAQIYKFTHTQARTLINPINYFNYKWLKKKQKRKRKVKNGTNTYIYI